MGEVMQQLKDAVKNYNDKRVGLIRIVILVLVLGVVMFCAEGFRAGRAEIVIWIVTVLSAIGLLVIYNVFEFRFYQYAALCLIVLGGLSLFIQPIMNIPDEVAHSVRTEMVSRGQLMIEPTQEKFETIRAMSDLYENTGNTVIRTSLWGTKIDKASDHFHHVASTTPTFLYIPQSIGMIIAKILNLDVIWLMWLGRFTNLLVYSAIIGLAIKIAPCLKFLLFFVSLLPMSVQQAASLSPDAMINSLSILLVAYFLYLFCGDRQIITNKNIILFLILCMIVTLAKVTNICIAGLFLLLPLEEVYGKKKTVLFKIGAIGIIVITGAAYYYYTTTFVVNLGTQAYYLEKNINSIQQVQYIMGHFLLWLRHFGASLINQCITYMNMLNSFGWLDYGYSILTPVMIFMFVKLCQQEKEIIVQKFDKFLIFLMVIGIYVLTSFALYLTWTPIGASNVEGVQGRYFIPLIVLLMLPLCNADKQNIHKNKNDMTVIVGMVCSYLLVTAARYY